MSDMSDIRKNGEQDRVKAIGPGMILGGAGDEANALDAIDFIDDILGEVGDVNADGLTEISCSLLDLKPKSWLQTNSNFDIENKVYADAPRSTDDDEYPVIYIIGGEELN